MPPTHATQLLTTSTVPEHWAEFDPKAYLNEYYSDLGGENLALLRFFVSAYRTIPAHSTLLDFGGGPTVYPLFAAADKVREIHFCDYLEVNLREVQQWLDGAAAAFDWRAFVEATVELETGGVCSPADARRREIEVRSRVTQVFFCDARRIPPLVEGYRTYDVVSSNFCAESATTEWWEWCLFMANISSLLKSGGRFIVSALKEATSYTVGPKVFPAVSITERELHSLLIALGFVPDSIEIVSVPADRTTRHYRGLMFASATKK